jgi:hypothetical protein
LLLTEARRKLVKYRAANQHFEKKYGVAFVKLRLLVLMACAIAATLYLGSAHDTMPSLCAVWRVIGGRISCWASPALLRWYPTR